MATYLRGNILLFKFYFEHIFTIRSLPAWMRNPDTLKQVCEEKSSANPDSPFTLELQADIYNKYNNAFERLKGSLRQLHNKENETFTYKTQLFLLFFLRFLCIISAAYGDVKLSLILSLAQFVVAPYSLFVSFALLIALAPPIYASHYIAFAGIRKCAEIVLSTLNLDIALLDVLSVPINVEFIVAFFIIDQALCCYCHFLTPSKEFTVKETIIHCIWGFINTKTYHVVLLLHLAAVDFNIPLLVWFIDAAFKITPFIADNVSKFWMHWLELFYHQHRMAHLPKVYEHAHKLHHYLHGTNAFDAHIYGNGMPEEFFFMLLEVGMGLYARLTPASLNRFILQHSIDNKFGHTQKPEDKCGENFHADHHLLHVKNFGIYNCLMDMYFKTANFSDKYMVKLAMYNVVGKAYTVQKSHQENKVVFTFTPEAV